MNDKKIAHVLTGGRVKHTGYLKRVLEGIPLPHYTTSEKAGERRING